MRTKNLTISLSLQVKCEQTGAFELFSRQEVYPSGIMSDEKQFKSPGPRVLAERRDFVRF